VNISRDQVEYWLTGVIILLATLFVASGVYVYFIK
jgi:hypothetical protein